MLLGHGDAAQGRVVTGAALHLRWASFLRSGLMPQLRGDVISEGAREKEVLEKMIRCFNSSPPGWARFGCCGWC